MRVNVNGKTYSFSFQYDRLTNIEKNEDVLKPIATHCRIHELANEEDKIGTLVAEGLAKCHWKDQFSKAEGRKLALGRALNATFPHDDRPLFPKVDRTQFWEKYKSMARV